VPSKPSLDSPLAKEKETIQIPKPEVIRRSRRERRCPIRFTFDNEHRYVTVKCYLKKMYSALPRYKGHRYKKNNILTLAINPKTGLFENIDMNKIGTGDMFKASKKSDPDTPTIKEVLCGLFKEEFIEAMVKEIQELEEHGTWIVMLRSKIPEGANIIPSMWAFKIKRSPDGEIKKFKARFCAREDKQIEGIDYFETYAPVVSWSTIRMLLYLSQQYRWYTKAVDFANAFVHAEIKEDVYMSLPAMFQDDSGIQNKELVLKLKKSSYGLAQSLKA